MADVSAADIPKIVKEFAKDETCPWCKSLCVLEKKLLGLEMIIW